MKVLLIQLVCLLSINFITVLCRRELVIAHRGDSQFAPENTFAAFEMALEKQTDGIETDLRISKDGHIVLIHDDWVNRTTNGTGLVANMTLAELQALDAGSWFGPQFKGQRVPSMQEFLDWFQTSAPSIQLVVLDLKVEGLGQPLAELLADYNMTDRFIASCWYPSQMIDIQLHLNGTIPIQSLTRVVPADPTDQFFEDSYAMNIRGFSVAFGSLTQNFIRKAHARLFSVVAWTVQDTTTVQQLSSIGIDGIITNDVVAVMDALVPATPPPNKPEDKPPVSTAGIVFIALGTLVGGMLIGLVIMFIAAKRTIYQKLPSPN